MRGQILSFDETSGTGLISGDDGIRYTFGRSAVTPPASIASGLRVDFVPVAGEATNIMLLAAAPPSPGYSANPGVPSGGATDGFDAQKVFLSFYGRTRRSHFWIAWLCLFGANLVLNFIPILGALISLALLWPNFAIQVTRLHDMGRSGWLVLIPIVATVVGVIAMISIVGVAAFTNMQGLENEDPAVVMATFLPVLGIGAVMLLVGLGFLLWIGLSDSQPGENRYGPNPKGL